MNFRQIITYILSAAIIFIAGVILIFAATGGETPKNFLVWFFLAAFIIASCMLWLASHQPIDVAGELRERGWEVDKPTSAESAIPTSLLTYSQLDGQFVRSLFWGHRSDSSIDLVYGEIKESSKNQNDSLPFLFARARLPRPVVGWVKVRPQFKGEVDHDIHLESNDFNQRFDVHADPKALATKVLSPDIMNWYLDLEPKPRLYVEGSACYILFKQDISDTMYISAAETMVKKFADLLVHSGALEQKSV